MEISLSSIKSFLLDNKTSRQTIIKNAFWLTAAEVLVKVLSFIAIIFLARHLGPDNYGKIAFATSFVAIFSFIIDFGFPTFAAREMAKDKTKSSKYIENIFSMEIGLGLLTFVAIFFSAKIFTTDKEFLWLICLLGVSSILDIFTLFFQSVFCANEKIEYTAISKILQGVILSFMIFWAAIGGYGLIFVGYSYIVSSLCATVATYLATWHRFSRFSLKIDPVFCKNVIKGAWPIALLYFASLIFQSLDAIMIGFYKGQADVGIYSAASKIIFSTYLVLSILYSIFLSPISRAFHEKSDKLKNIVEKYGLATLFFGMPLSIGGAIIAPNLISFLYGIQYLNSVVPFILLSAGLVFIFMVSFYGYCLIFFDKQREFLRANILGVFLNVILDIFLIPTFGVVGACIAALLVQVVIMIVSLIEFNKILKINIIGMLNPTILSSLFMAGIIILAKVVRISNPVFLILIAIASYFLVYYALYSKSKNLRSILA